MAKDILKDFHSPAGDYGRGVAYEIAALRCDTLRATMMDAAKTAFAIDCELDNDEMIAAWDLLNITERNAWRALVALGRMYGSK